MKEDDGWIDYDFTKAIEGSSLFTVYEFLAGEDAPNGSFKKGDVIKTQAFAMNTSFFSHYRPVSNIEDK